MQQKLKVCSWAQHAPRPATTAIQMGLWTACALLLQWQSQVTATASRDMDLMLPSTESLLTRQALLKKVPASPHRGFDWSPQKSRLTIFLNHGFKANFHCANAEWNSSPHPTAAWAKRRLCINQLPYFGNGARSGSSTNASRDLSATKSLQQSAIAAITKSCSLRLTKAHIGSDVANTGKWTWMKHQAGKKAVKGYSVPLHYFIGLVSSPSHLWENFKLSDSQKYNCTISQRQQIKHNQQPLFETE